MAIVMRRRTLYILILLVAAAVGYVVYDWVTVTPEEALAASTDRIVSAVRERDVDKLMAEFAPDYDEGDMDRKALEKIARAFFAAYPPLPLRRLGRTIHVQGTTAVVELRVTCRIEFPKRLGGRTRSGDSDWRFTYIRQNKRWVVDRVQPVHIGDYKPTSLRDAARKAGITN